MLVINSFQACPVEKISDFVPTETKPSTQLIIDCDEGGVASSAGLQAGDFIIEVRYSDHYLNNWS